MTMKKTARSSVRPSPDDVDIRFATPRASAKDGPVRRETIEVEMSWLEKAEEPEPITVVEPVLRREPVIRREPAAVRNGGRKSNPKMAAPDRAATAKVTVRKVAPAGAKPARTSDPAAGGASDDPLTLEPREPPPLSGLPARVERPVRLSPTIPREEGPDSLPPPRRSSKPPRRRG